MEAVFGHSKDYSLKQYLAFATKLQNRAKVSHACSTRGHMTTYIYIYISVFIISSWFNFFDKYYMCVCVKMGQLLITNETRMWLSKS